MRCREGVNRLGLGTNLYFGATSAEGNRMGQRAAVYKVQVREKGKRKGAFRRLGNIDGEGTPLREVFEKILTDFQSATDDRLKVISATAVRTVGQGDLEIDLIHGQSGEVAEIYDGDGAFRIRHFTSSTSSTWFWRIASARTEPCTSAFTRP